MILLLTRFATQLTPTLALLLTHDLLLSKNGVAAPKQHILTLSISRHKARLSAEFTKCRIRRGFPSVEAFRTHINDAPSDEGATATGTKSTTTAFHPRWVRVNTLKTTLEKALSSTFSGLTRVSSLKDLASTPRGVYVDEHIPNLVAISPKVDLSKHAAYGAGQIIFQDKASCFPAYLLAPEPNDHVVDACAAPGNKTTHVAAILSHGASSAKDVKVTACERNPARAQTLQKMVRLAGANSIVTVKASQDFTKLNPHAPAYADVGALLLDPSCSGSGIIGRDDTAVLHLPSTPSSMPAPTSSKKRKRKGGAAAAAAAAATPVEAPPQQSTTAANELSEETPDTEETDAEKLKTRLANLASFQLKIIQHAFKFPSATKVTYSTCSVHAEENEHVVVRALASSIAKERGWRILPREDQVSGMRAWARRGESAALLGHEGLLQELGVDGESVREACIRCERGTEEGTMGFFVAGFVRDATSDGADANADVPAGEPREEPREEDSDGENEEWAGFSGDEE